MAPNESLTAHESIEIITRMINETKGNLKRNAFYFILWGWVVVLANIGVFVLSSMQIAYPHAMWFITIPAWIYSLYKGFTQEKRIAATTHLDKITGWLWVAFGLTILVIIIFGYQVNFEINALILTFSFLPTFVSGVIIRFKPLIYGGASLLAFGILSFLVPRTFEPLVGAVAICCAYLIPGYLLKSKQD